MGFRIRSLRLVTCILAFFAIAALPGLWSHQNPGSTLGPAIAWAGGTPDETLNPPPTPPQQTSKSGKSSTWYGYGSTIESDPTAARLDSAMAKSRTWTWNAFWLIARATLLRI
jgi:hypothetical protein